MKTVTFCGHSKIFLRQEPDLEKKLEKVIEKLIAEGAEEFLLGG